MDGCELSRLGYRRRGETRAEAVHARRLPGLKGKEGRKEAGDGEAVQTEARIIRA